jgi:hypothetical protein
MQSFFFFICLVGLSIAFGAVGVCIVELACSRGSFRSYRPRAIRAVVCGAVGGSVGATAGFYGWIIAGLGWVIARAVQLAPHESEMATLAVSLLLPGSCIVAIVCGSVLGWRGWRKQAGAGGVLSNDGSVNGGG